MTDFRKEGRCTGHANVPLNEEGIGEAVDLERKLARYKIAAIYCSPFDRTVQTAKILAHRRELEPIPDPRLRPVKLGIMEGLTKLKAREKFCAPRFQYMNPNFDFRELGGDRSVEVVARQIEFLNEMTRRHFERHPPDACSLAVGHSLALRHLIEFLGFTWEVRKNGGYQEISFEPATLEAIEGRPE
ncbi:MAG: histidine phosphatase family protein [Candidatus Woesebacteria bacterium]|nr:histidine phosphatase family protein [Candidatus Woesebacteria bacterium]